MESGGNQICRRYPNRPSHQKDHHKGDRHLCAGRNAEDKRTRNRVMEEGLQQIPGKRQGAAQNQSRHGPREPDVPQNPPFGFHIVHPGKGTHHFPHGNLHAPHTDIEDKKDKNTRTQHTKRRYVSVFPVFIHSLTPTLFQLEEIVHSLRFPQKHTMDILCQITDRKRLLVHIVCRAPDISLLHRLKIRQQFTFIQQLLHV